METVAEILPQVSRFVGESGTCDQVEGLDGLNRARRLLWNKLQGGALVTDYICIKCFDDCIYLPSAYQSIILAWMGDEAVSLGNEWYQSLPGYGGHDHHGQNSCHKKFAETGGYHVVFQQPDHPCQIAIQCENNADTGTQITISGIDSLQTNRDETLTAKVSPMKVKTKRKYIAVAKLVKPKTQGRIRLYSIAENGDYTLLAIYQPYDVNPSFVKLRFAGRKCKTMTLFVKKKFHVLDQLTDLVEFSTEALEFAAQADTSKLSKNNSGYAENLNLAIQEQNRVTADHEVPTASPMRQFHNDTPINLL